MANVFGQLQNKTKPLEVPLIINTSTTTHLNLSSHDEEQNKTRDPAKILLRTVAPEILTIKLIKNLPGSITYTRDFVWSSEDSPSTIVNKWKAQMRPFSSSFSGVYNKNLEYGSITDVFYQVDRYFGSDLAKGIELVLPFDSSIFESPLTFVSELKLSTDLETALTNSIGLQFTLAEDSSFTEGTLAVIGDTLKLQTETLSDPLSSTYTVKLRNLPLPDPLPVLGVLVRRNTLNPDVAYLRWFYWSPVDTPAQMIIKWNDQMRVFVDGTSFGHLTLTYDTNTGKLAPLFDYSTDFGLPEGFGWFSRFDGNDASKQHIGMVISPGYLNPVGYYYRSVKIDVFITGSNGLVPRQVVFDISPSVEDFSTFRKRKYTLIINHSNDVTFFSDATDVLRDTEAGSTRLWWFNCNSSRDITLDDFSLKIIQSELNINSNFSGLFGKTVNGTTMNLVNSIERIEDLLYTLQEKINIVSCTATPDSWTITTDNVSGDVQINVVPAYSTDDIEVFVKNSPAFVNNINISTSIDWNNSDGWRVISSSTFQNNASYAANAAFDKNSSTYWGSAEGTFTTAGVGSQSLTIEYPQALKISSLRFEGSTRYPGVTAPTEWTLSGSNDTTFTDIQSYEKTNWSSNIAAAFDVTTDHIAYRFYKVTFTKVTAGSGSTYVSVPDITFITVHPIGAHLLSVYPMSTNTFKIIMGNAEGPMQEDSFKRNAIDLARASYLPLDQAGTFGESLGFTLHRQLSQADTLVYTDNRTGQPTIVHRGSTTPRDFLVDDALIAFGSGRETQRQRRAREITTATEAKYKMPSNSTGHSLGGRLAERSGSRGSIVTFNKAAGLGDIPNFNFTGRSQPEIQNGSRQTDVRTRLDPVSILSSFGRRPSGQAPLVVVPQRDQANRFLPGPVSTTPVATSERREMQAVEMGGKTR
ncbi:hypothetical protein T492DRAFT_838683 [Pavlovales sp. CCMP2436]|nr:hypothetical protein T492DRAFT_838683 [Pavlovales sp. CCMP2436]